MGASVLDVVESVEWVTPDGVMHERARSHFNAGYRDCPELNGAFALSAVLRAPEVAGPEVVRARMEANAGRRRETQPRDPSAGCTFKNPRGDSAGRPVDAHGLKGLRALGDAEVSEVHAEFHREPGRRLAADVIELIRACAAW